MAAETADQAQHRWWEQYTWLVSTQSADLPYEGRAEILAALRRRAIAMKADNLVAAADVDGNVLYGWLAEQLEREGQ